MLNKDELYNTTDLYLAALIKAKDIKLVKTMRQGNKFVFCFEDKGNIEELIQNFYNNSEMVSAYKLINAIKDIKSMTYNIK